MNHNRTISGLAAMLIGLCLLGCSREKEIEVILPDYESELVVECYLVPGEPYQLVLQESVSYFAEPTLPFVDDALVVISHDGKRDTLRNEIFFGSPYGKIYNYISDETMPMDIGGEWTLEVEDGLGREITGRTVLLDTVSFELEFSKTDSFRNTATARWDDDANAANYYQYIVQFGSLDSQPYLSFTLDDRVGNGDEFVISTLDNLYSGLNCYFTLLHFEEGAWRFLGSTSDAESSNGNPFAQPSQIFSNVEGGIGVFATMATTRLNRIVP